MTVLIDVSPGELIDKITILEIKVERIADPARRGHAQHELDVLRVSRARLIASSPSLDAIAGDLKSTNAALWDIEDAIRVCERERDFGARFIDLARAVYRTNDRRADLKNQINVLLDSTLVEVKSYARYDAG